VSQNKVLTCFTITIKIHQNLALQSSRYSDKTVAVSQNVFAVSKVKTNEYPRWGPQYFASVGSVANENSSVLRGF